MGIQCVSADCRRASLPFSEPSITTLPASITAPPISDASTAVSTSTCRPEWILAACAAALLSACGGSGGDDASGSQKTATGLSADTCELKCEMGGINIEGSVTTRLNAKCELGSIYALLEEPDDYGWSAKAAFGSATVDGHSASGMDSISSGGNGSASTFFNLECGMGSIEIEFN